MADKYTLTKEGKGDVHTSSEAVKVRHLADGFVLQEPAKPDAQKPSAPKPNDNK